MIMITTATIKGAIGVVEENEPPDVGELNNFGVQADFVSGRDKREHKHFMEATFPTSEGDAAENVRMRSQNATPYHQNARSNLPLQMEVVAPEPCGTRSEHAPDREATPHDRGNA